MAAPATYFQTKYFDSWDEAAPFASSLSLRRGWIFRGQSCADWPLSSSLEREADGFDIRLADRKKIESDLVTKFARNAHLHVMNPPEEDNILEMLALMQHHGAPTRLLDWTYSVHVAAYFAFETSCPGDSCAVWAINYRWCNKQSERILLATFRNVSDLKKEYGVQEPKVFQKYLWKRPF